MESSLITRRRCFGRKVFVPVLLARGCRVEPSGFQSFAAPVSAQKQFDSEQTRRERILRENTRGCISV